MEERVVLVNPQDEVLGLMEKMQAHENALLHRAFSVFLFNDKGEMLLQQRAAGKYHSPLQWTNACCSHPRENESYLDAAKRRLQEELGISSDLTERFHFLYKADVGQGLWEHELDYVFTGEYNGEFALNAEEVAAIKYISIDELKQEIEEFPERYTEWFKIIWDEYRNHLELS
ncbi:isopentenyl-diphosphate Delta-isomerase [Soonwooa sp.]|uniref:isopentenyl-diphosphate Delta-isomerase n=1 Tax=Soonwooa sp. TaxID=1938592 RepID=UPI0026073BCD|nr:isopentenyl-diphosphate Delta-isomerase [Soonwooa sp.]